MKKWSSQWTQQFMQLREEAKKNSVSKVHEKVRRLAQLNWSEWVWIVQTIFYPSEADRSKRRTILSRTNHFMRRTELIN